MRIEVLGTGMVGTTLAGKLRELGHQVQVGSRDGSKGDGPSLRSRHMESCF